MDCTKEFVENHQVGIAVAVTSVVGILMLKQYLKGGQCSSKVMLTGKTALITGCNTGLGKETARDFARRGARVLMACRDITKAENAAKEIQESTGNENIVVYKLDLSSLESVKSCAAEVIRKESRLDILVNNAGLMWCPHLKTVDGYELQFGTNHLGHFLLTNLLLDLVKKSAPSRIVTVSSLGHLFIKQIDFDNLNAEKEYSKVMAYSLSKLANILFTRELSQRLEGTGVTANSLHPGAVASDLLRHIETFPFYYRWPLFICYHYLGGRYMIKNVTDGAQTSIYVSVSEEVENVSGKYFSDCALMTPSPVAQDDDAAAKLWAVSEKMTGLK